MKCSCCDDVCCPGDILKYEPRLELWACNDCGVIWVVDGSLDEWVKKGVKKLRVNAESRSVEPVYEH